jgi:hypothetical protein
MLSLFALGKWWVINDLPKKEHLVTGRIKVPKLKKNQM